MKESELLKVSDVAEIMAWSTAHVHNKTCASRKRAATGRSLRGDDLPLPYAVISNRPRWKPEDIEAFRIKFAADIERRKLARGEKLDRHRKRPPAAPKETENP